MSQTPQKGWIGTLLQEASLTKEEMVGSPAEAAQTTFLTMSYPVVNPSTKVVTDDENDVTLYVDDVAQDPLDFTLTGAEGKIVFDTAPGVDTVIRITYTYSLESGWVLDASPSLDGQCEELYGKSGSRLPQAIGEGNIRLRVRVSKAYVGRDQMDKAIAKLEDNELPEFTLEIYPLGNISEKPKITFTGCKCGSWELANDQAGWVADNAEFLAKTITPGTVT